MKNSGRISSVAGNPATWWLRVAALLLVLSAMLLGGAPVHAAAPPAGAQIGNAAAATYDDGSGTKTVTSNQVVTVVAQVASFTLTSTQSKPGAPGTTIYFPHTLTNTGNGTDTFNLSATDVNAGTFNFTSVTLYADANGDGVPDNLTPITSTGALAAGAQFKFVAAAVVPGTATDGQIDVMTVTAVGNAAAATAGGYTAAATQTNLDTVTVTGQAVIDVTKAISSTSGASPSGPYTITLSYRNNGFANATSVVLTDALPTGMTYVAGSGRWSTSGATALTDAAGGDPVGINYSVTGSTITATVAGPVVPGATGQLTFQVNIASGVAPGALNNTATFSYNNGAAVVPAQNTNTATITVLQTAAVTATDAGSTANGVAPTLGLDGDGTTNDVVVVNSAPQGSTVQFDNVIINNGNGTDTFDILLSGSNFPAGTTLQLFKSDGVTPLVNTGGGGEPDTGPVAPGASYHVIVKAVLPGTATGGGPYSVTKTARSVVNPTVTDTVTDRLGTIATSTVDLTNNTALPGAPGAGAGPEATPVTTNTVAPGSSTTFRLVVNNTSTVTDNYDLSVLSLLSGWTATFHNDGGAGNCSTVGAAITNTGTVAAGGNKLVCAVISVPAGALVGTTNIDFRVASVASGATDTKRDAVSVTAAGTVTLTPNGVGQIAPGAVKEYTHTLTNSSNTAQTITFPVPTTTDTLSGWSSTLYIDNGSVPGAFDAGDTQVIPGTTTFVLAPGATQNFIVRVTSPVAAATGQIDTTTITINANGTPVSATDTTTVVLGVLTLTKEQALDANCDGTPDGAFTSGNITSGAIPGACVRYRITATNNGTASLSNVVVSDSVPSNTTYNTGAVCPAAGAAVAATTVGSITAPANCAIGSLSASVGTLTPGQSAVITFGVEIDK